jgi:hypothetical protein
VLLILAATDSAAYQSIFLWSLALIGLLLVGFFVVMKVKARMREPDQPVSVGFSLSDLRQMHQQGQLSDEEFERAKGKLLATMQKVEKPVESRRDATGSGPSTDEWIERTRARRKQREQDQKPGGDQPEQSTGDM